MPPDAVRIDRPEDATAEWLTTTLAGSGRIPAGPRIVDVGTEGIGNGKVGQNVRFALTWTEADGIDVPSSVVGKFASDDPTSRQAGLLTGTYVREIGFYRELGDRVAMSIPRCHAAELDVSTGAFVLLFDDITPADTGDQVAGCSVDDAARAMEELALLHAGFWGAADLSDGTWLIRRSDDGGAALAAMYDAFVDAFLGRFGPRLSENAVGVVEGLRPLVAAWIQTDIGFPLTLLHGDYRLENMLFGRGGGMPALTTVDWQTPNRNDQ